jgi:hypothetical protein
MEDIAMPASQSEISTSLLDQIPPPDVIVQKLGETNAELRALRALLRVSKLKHAQSQNSTEAQVKGEDADA